MTAVLARRERGDERRMGVTGLDDPASMALWPVERESRASAIRSYLSIPALDRDTLDIAVAGLMEVGYAHAAWTAVIGAAGPYALTWGNPYGPDMTGNATYLHHVACQEVTNLRRRSRDTSREAPGNAGSEGSTRQ